MTPEVLSAIDATPVDMFMTAALLIDSVGAYLPLSTCRRR